MKINTALKEYGLDEKEVEIYIYLLKNIDSTAFSVSRDTGLPKTTVYYLLEKMHQNGLVNIWKKNNVKNYSLESPNKLIERLKDKEKIIFEIMPQIRALSDQSKHRPVVRMYSGQKGITTALNEVLEDFKRKEMGEVLQYVPEGIFDKIPVYFPKWIEFREKSGIQTRVISPQVDTNSKFSKYYKDTELKKVRFLKDELPFEGWVHIYNNKMVSVTIEGEDLNAIIIESYATIKMITRFFEYTWNSLPENDFFVSDTIKL